MWNSKFFTFSRWLSVFNRCTNKNVDGMKLIQFLLCDVITANVFPRVLVGSSRAFRGLI